MIRVGVCGTIGKECMVRDVVQHRVAGDVNVRGSVAVDEAAHKRAKGDSGVGQHVADVPSSHGDLGGAGLLHMSSLGSGSPSTEPEPAALAIFPRPDLPLVMLAELVLPASRLSRPGVEGPKTVL